MRASVGSAESFLRKNVRYSGEDCLEWPFCKIRKGYGFAKIGGQKKTASRWMCLLAHGEPPLKGMEAAHMCGNSSCVNPNHIRWATSKENALDKIKMGTIARGVTSSKAKLTEALVHAIRADTRARRIIAEDFGMSIRQVFKIQVKNHGSTFKS